MKKSVLVTGGAGFIGSHMADRLLADGNRVIILDNESTGVRENIPPEAEYIKGDVRNDSDVEKAFSAGVDVVIHIAGQASTILSFNNPEADLLTNTLGTINVLKACLKHRVSRVLYASSMTAYGHPTQLPVTEDVPVAPVSYYGITKYAAERYLLTTALRNDLDFPFHVTAFRMFNVYGERQRLDNPYQGVMGIFVGNVLREETIKIFGDGLQSRDFIYIRDVVNAWVSAVDNPNSYGQVFNLGFGSAISINDLVDEVLAANGKSRAGWEVQYFPPRPGDQRFMYADIAKARTILGWEPKFNLAEGLAHTLDWAKGTL